MAKGPEHWHDKVRNRYFQGAWINTSAVFISEDLPVGKKNSVTFISIREDDNPDVDLPPGLYVVSAIAPQAYNRNDPVIRDVAEIVQEVLDYDKPEFIFDEGETSDLLTRFNLQHCGYVDENSPIFRIVPTLSYLSTLAS